MSTKNSKNYVLICNRSYTENGMAAFSTKGAFRLDAKQREAKVGDLREWAITSATFASLREWLLIFATGRFIG